MIDPSWIRMRAARDRLGLTAAEMARMLETVPGSIYRMEMLPTHKSFRRPAPRMERLIRAYLAGYRPPDWPHDR